MKNTNCFESVASSVREFGVVAVVESIVDHADATADFAHSCNDKHSETHWRQIACFLIEALGKIESLPEKPKKF